MTRADLDKWPGEVSAMFDRVAERYDLMNDVLSLGQDRWWRRVVARIVGARPGERVLDLAAGTGSSSVTFTMAGADCVACDFSLGMLQRYLTTALPAIARRLSRAPDAYSYLAESIKDWAAQAGVARRIAAAGWSAVRWRDLTMGVVTVHVARRPG